jgi:hypothetical protein
MRDQDQLIPMEEGFHVGGGLAHSFHCQNSCENIDRFVILCRSSNSTGQFFDNTAGDRRQH